MLYARRGLGHHHARLGSLSPLQVGGGLMRRRVSCSASAVTHGQRLRGHGQDGWKDAGWDYMSPKKLDPELRGMLVHYGQLAQVTYDHLGMDPSQPNWGYTTVAAHQLIDYLTQEYPLAPDMRVDRTTPKGTNEIYKIPTSGNLSPMIYACAGSGDPAAAEAKVTTKKSLNRIIDNFINRLFVKVASVPTALIGGSRPLFRPDPATGRLGMRPAFMGFVAVSKPNGDAKEVDVVFVWRGTIYKEEWAANFGEDMVMKCTWDAFASDGSDGSDSTEIAKPWEIGVHNGFQDLYLRRAEQPKPKSEAVPAERQTDNEQAPAEIVRAWMAELMATNNVTTITTTGHSLGGALSTVSGYDIARELDALWADDKDKIKAREHWVTEAKPKVTAIAFAPPRVGNWTFVRKFSDELKVKQLRICNINDFVPKVPGIWVQILTSIWDRVGINVFNDMDSRAVKVFGWLYYGGCWLSAKLLQWPSRWGFFHAGTILEVDSDKEFDGVGATPDIGQYHNLEVYLYLLSKKGRESPTDRNPLLLNKSDDILVDKNSYPADWWHYQTDRHVTLDENSGRWVTGPFWPRPKKKGRAAQQ